jgi:hypothetical protein
MSVHPLGMRVTQLSSIDRRVMSGDQLEVIGYQNLPSKLS